MKSMTPIRDLTAAARAGLSGNWGKSIGVLLVYVLFSIVIRQIRWSCDWFPKLLITWILDLLIGCPLLIGATAYFLASIRREDNRVRLIFRGFGCYKSSICVFLLTALLLTAWMLPLQVLFYQLVAMLFGQILSSVFGNLWGVVAILLAFLLASPVFVYLLMRYGLASWLIADDSTMSARRAIRRSVELMRGNYWRLSVLWFRLTGWVFLAMLPLTLWFVWSVPYCAKLILGIGFIWLGPYCMAATAAFYDDLTRNG